MSKRGLGRGLDALLPSSPMPSESREVTGLRGIEVDSLDPNPRQPRRNFDDESLEELAASIRALGVLQPLLVRAAPGDRFEIIAGERRWRAARLAGLDRVPVVVVDTDERGSLERALVENVHRADLNPIEEAAAYKQLIEEGGLTQEALGDRIGKNRVTISGTLRLLDLPVSIQSFIAGGRLSAAHGRILLGLQGNPFLDRLGRRAAEEGWSTRETEEQLRRYESMSGSRGQSRVSPEDPVVAIDLQRRLSEHLQTRVRVEVGKRKGKIVVDFVSPEELDRLADIILGRSQGARRTIAIPE